MTDNSFLMVAKAIYIVDLAVVERLLLQQPLTYRIDDLLDGGYIAVTYYYQPKGGDGKLVDS